MKKTISFVIAALLCFAMTDFVFARSSDAFDTASVGKSEKPTATIFRAKDAQTVQADAAMPGAIREIATSRISAIRNDWINLNAQPISLGYRGESVTNRIRSEPPPA